MTLQASRLALLAQTYTPGTVFDQATQNGSTGPAPPSRILGQQPAAAPRVPILGVLLILGLLFLLERRRIRRSLR